MSYRWQELPFMAAFNRFLASSESIPPPGPGPCSTRRRKLYDNNCEHSALTVARHSDELDRHMSPLMSIPPTFLSHVFTRKLFALVGNSLLVYDYLISLSLEITYVWNAPWTVVKAIFLINRYGNLIGQTFIMLEETGYLTHNSQKFCVAYELYCAFFAIFSGESIRLLVVMRACAILGFKRNITVLANALYVICALTILAASLYLLRNVEYTQFEYLDETGICFAPVPSNVWALWFIPFVFDVLVLVIVCYSLYRVSKWTRDRNPSQLVRLLTRDAFMFYFAALFNVLFFMTCWTIFRLDPRNALATMFTFPLLSVVGQRFVLNLRRFRVGPDSTRDLSREIHRQIAAIVAELPHHPSSPGLELEELGGMTREADLAPR